MADPPRPPPSKKAGKSAADRERAALAELVEVERALAALEGRKVENAEHMVVQRQEAEKRRAALEQIIASSRVEIARRRRLLPYKIGAAVIGVGVAAALAVPATHSVMEVMEARAAAAANAGAVGAPFQGRFAVARTEVGNASFTVEAGKARCFVIAAATTKGPATVRIERKTGSKDAPGSVGFCSCEPEEARITLTGEQPVAAVVLEAAAGAIGGADVLAAMPDHPAATFAETIDRPCADAAFDEWAVGNKSDAPPPDKDKLTADEKALAATGLTPILLAAADAPFVLPPPAENACFVALARGGATIHLRQKGGDRSITARNGAVGFCAKNTAGLSFWREGSGEVAVFRAVRDKVGGLLGLREAAARGGVSIAAWTPGDDLAGDAYATLVASGVALPVGLESKRGSAFALSTDARSILATTDLGPDVHCQPELVVGATQVLCIEGRYGAFALPQKPPGMASGPAPLWLAMPPKPDRTALTRALDMLAFARRMNSEGYELTSLVGANFTPDGIVVTGRSGESQIVALVTSSAPPYLHTLAVGPPWTLTNPRATPLPPTGTVRLVASPRFNGRATREFVVFRK